MLGARANGGDVGRNVGLKALFEHADKVALARLGHTLLERNAEGDDVALDVKCFPHDVEDLHREFLLAVDLTRVDDRVEHVDGRADGIDVRDEGDLRRARGRTTTEGREMGANKRRRHAARGAFPRAQTRHSPYQAGSPPPLQRPRGVEAGMCFHLALHRKDQYGVSKDTGEATPITLL